MTYIKTTDWLTEVSRGNVTGAIRLNKSGWNHDIDTGTSEDLWDGTNTWVAPTADRVHSIVSTNTNDTAAGTGARTLFVRGISGVAITTEIISLNGTTPVNTVNAYSIIDYMYINTVGSGATNAGVITATSAVDATITAQINVDNTNQTQMAITQVPNGYNYYLYNWACDMYNSNASSSCEVWLQTKLNSGAPWLTRRISFLSNSGDSNKTEHFAPPLVIPEGAYIKIRAGEVSNNNTKVSGYFNGVLIAI